LILVLHLIFFDSSVDVVLEVVEKLEIGEELKEGIKKDVVFVYLCEWQGNAQDLEILYLEGYMKWNTPMLVNLFAIGLRTILRRID